MHDRNQDERGDSEPEGPRDPALDAPANAPAGETSPVSDAASAATARTPDLRDLTIWLIAIVVLGGAGLVFQQAELAALVALAGLYVTAQAADLDGRWTPLYYSLSWVVPAGAVVTFSSLVVLLAQRHETTPIALVMGGLALFGAVASGLLVLRPVSNPLCRLVFANEEPTHALRLTLRLFVGGIVLALPAWYTVRDLISDVLVRDSAAFERSLWGPSIVGMVVLALASVGFRLRRDFPATLERLGLAPLRASDLLWIAGGLAGLVALNGGLDAVQQRFFPALAASDTAITKAIVAHFGPAQMLMLGLSAGVGEELTMRGALQPRLGIGLTSLLFASLHVQYSWFGMGTILLLGILLGLLRQRTSTTVAIAVHAIYDVISAFAASK